MKPNEQYDKQVAEQLALLKALGLRVHIPRVGPVFFSQKKKAG